MILLIALILTWFYYFSIILLLLLFLRALISIVWLFEILLKMGMLPLDGVKIIDICCKCPMDDPLGCCFSVSLAYLWGSYACILLKILSFRPQGSLLGSSFECSFGWFFLRSFLFAFVCVVLSSLCSCLSLFILSFRLFIRSYLCLVFFYCYLSFI